MTISDILEHSAWAGAMHGLVQCPIKSTKETPNNGRDCQYVPGTKLIHGHKDSLHCQVLHCACHKSVVTMT